MTKKNYKYLKKIVKKNMISVCFLFKTWELPNVFQVLYVYKFSTRYRSLRPKKKHLTT